MAAATIGDVIGDYRDNPQALIVQQNNCTARQIHKRTLAFDISLAFGYTSNPYLLRAQQCRPGIFQNLACIVHRAKMGDVHICDNGPGRARVACLFAQYRMGTPNHKYYMHSPRVDDEYKQMPDDSDSRLRAFEQCLERLRGLLLEQYDDINVIAFPERIGCGKAGGDWNEYKSAIQSFAVALSKKNVSVMVVRKKYKWMCKALFCFFFTPIFSFF